MQTADNKELTLAWKFIEQTDTNIFLTGKAGTGKTTFLRKLKELSPKRMVVVAPTGVAAINAEGVTIHSLFQLPFSPYIPGTTFHEEKSKHRFSKEKKHILQSIDLLVIDEISMVRADLLDAIDSVMRRYRDRHQAFGGVQLLMIGDLQQLSPVIKEEEESLLKQHYDTLYFFGSKALREKGFITIELQNVYRQTNQEFIRILNAIRHGNISNSLLAKLNERYLPDFKTQNRDGYIRLTTHNHSATHYNNEQLNALDRISYSYRAEVTGNFPENSYPAEETLTLKQGAQVMFIKNDDTAERRFYNGKIAHIHSLSNSSITVICDSDDKKFDIEPMTWNNTRYTLNPETKEITEKIEGTFKQYPLRLAWAITIHKSQGLTFEKAVIDVASSFAHGQVYVALSRCKTLQGIVLANPILPHAIINDTSIDRFLKTKQEQTERAEQEFCKLQTDYFKRLLNELFNFNNIQYGLISSTRILDEHFYRLYPELLQQYKTCIGAIDTDIISVAKKFQNQYIHLIMDRKECADSPILQERIHKAAGYFSGSLSNLLENLLNCSTIETDNKQLRQRWNNTLQTLQEDYTFKKEILLHYSITDFSITDYLRYKAQLMLKLEELPTQKNKDNSKTRKKNKVAAALLIPSDIKNPLLFQALKEWRKKKSIEINLPAYTILQQKALIYMSNSQPTTLKELIEVPYFGQRSADKYGDDILSIIREFRNR